MNNLIPDSVFAAEVLGDCPDCENGKCARNCASAVQSFRNIIAAAVVEMEQTQSAMAHVGINRMLKKLHPILSIAAREKYTERNGKPPMRTEGRTGDDA